MTRLHFPHRLVLGTRIFTKNLAHLGFHVSSARYNVDSDGEHTPKALIAYRRDGDVVGAAIQNSVAEDTRQPSFGRALVWRCVR
jgi:hypothetical protein